MNRTAKLIVLVAALAGLTGALINGDWVIAVAFVAAAAAAGWALRMGRGAG